MKNITNLIVSLILTMVAYYYRKPIVKAFLQFSHFQAALAAKLNNWLNVVETEAVSIIEITEHTKARFIKFTFVNNHLLTNDKVLEPLYFALKQNKQFMGFGYNKAIIITAFLDGDFHQFHHNVIINNDTPFSAYYNEVSEYVNKLYVSDDSPYGIDVFEGFEVLV